MIGFLILLFIFVAGFFIMQMLIYRFVKKNIHKYTKIKWFHMWLHMNFICSHTVSYTHLTLPTI
ncbi:MAG TPA: hypothetical protein DEU22_06585, partial [Bacillus sp. (in: Bacteria)]|nr:hypothetical protein [Bacillus sp. (in: firmicutes)]